MGKTLSIFRQQKYFYFFSGDIALAAVQYPFRSSMQSLSILCNNLLRLFARSNLSWRFRVHP